MATMGRYCKAYYMRQLREFPAWRPNLRDLRPETTEVDGQEIQTPRTELGDEDILYVQESHVVTDGIFLDQHIVFDAVTPEWDAFCRDVLKFEVPEDDLAPIEEPAPAAAVEAQA